MGHTNPVPVILEVIDKLSIRDPQTALVNELQRFVAPLTDPINAWKQHKVNMASTLQTHWSSIHTRLDGLHNQDQFQGEAAQALQSRHQSLQIHSQDLHNHIVASSTADNTFLFQIDNALHEKSGEITRSHPAGAFLFLTALSAMSPHNGGDPTGIMPGTGIGTQSPTTGPLDPTTGPLEVLNPFDVKKPLIVRILLGIAELLAGLELAELIALILALALLVFCIYLIWLNSQPHPTYSKVLYKGVAPVAGPTATTNKDTTLPLPLFPSDGDLPQPTLDQQSTAKRLFNEYAVRFPCKRYLISSLSIHMHLRIRSEH